MKIAITANQPDLESEVDPRFGRCRCFIFVDPETMQFESIENAGLMAGGGAGVSTAQTIISHDVTAVLTGNCGPNAHQVLSASGISVITGVSGKISEVIKNFKSGYYQASQKPNVAEHFGAGPKGPGAGGRGMRHGQN